MSHDRPADLGIDLTALSRAVHREQEARHLALSEIAELALEEDLPRNELRERRLHASLCATCRATLRKAYERSEWLGRKPPLFWLLLRLELDARVAGPSRSLRATAIRSRGVIALLQQLIGGVRDALQAKAAIGESIARPAVFHVGDDISIDLVISAAGPTHFAVFSLEPVSTMENVLELALPTATGSGDFIVPAGRTRWEVPVGTASAPHGPKELVVVSSSDPAMANLIEQTRSLEPLAVHFIPWLASTRARLSGIEVEIVSYEVI